jgi:radical SAM family uncharacterized protein
MSDDILLNVHKPGRYIAQEWNVSRKPFDGAEVKFALSFPDLYEVGMSNLGLRIIYGLLNNLDGVICERVFSPDIDLEAILRKSTQRLLSLESKKELREFDLLGFSLSHELLFTNVLNILDLSGIPLAASARDEKYPLVIGGGPCALNPEPLAEFFDLFVLGEAEEAILEIIAVYRKFQGRFKAGKISKQELLLALCGIEGVYVPSFYEVNYAADGKIASLRPKVAAAPLKIKKRFIRDLDRANFISPWIVPYIQIVHDRISLEIMRGCPNNCRFCQARQHYFPFRQRSIPVLLELAQRAYKETGYEEISLCGLSAGDHRDILELTRALTDIFRDKAVSLSLPSLKPKDMLGNLSRLIAGTKKTGLTFAPEAGTERLRAAIGKDFVREEFFRALQEAYAAGYRHIKLYFMIGLPGEESSDLDGIIEFAEAASDLRRKVSRGPGQVNISVNTLIPKPHTPFQWLGMSDPQAIREKQEYLRKKSRNRRLVFSFHNPAMTFLEGVFSRGDRRLAQVIVKAHSKGLRFDAWQNRLNFAQWLEAFAECGVEPAFYLRERGYEEILPWDFLDIGISKESLWRDFEKTVAMQQDKRYNQY